MGHMAMGQGRLRNGKPVISWGGVRSVLGGS